MCEIVLSVFIFFFLLVLSCSCASKSKFLPFHLLLLFLNTAADIRWALTLAHEMKCEIVHCIVTCYSFIVYFLSSSTVHQLSCLLHQVSNDFDHPKVKENQKKIKINIIMKNERKKIRNKLNIKVKEKKTKRKKNEWN